MAIYDQMQQTGNNPWYAPQPGYQPQAAYQVPTVKPRLPTTPTGVSEFVWVNNPGTVDMWPVSAGSEMTFIDNENMILYVKRVDEYNHPLKVRRFKLTEVTDEEEVKTSSPTPQVNYDDLKGYITTEVNKAVSSRLGNLSTLLNGPQKEGIIDA